MNNVWFISDTHFGHKNIIKYDNRPFTDVEDMDKAMIDNWNSVVKNGDLVYHLGDFAFYRDQKQVEAVLAQLKGQKYLIEGNHDHKQVRRAKGWTNVLDYYELKVDMGGSRKQLICLFHYPMMTWNTAHHESWHLHGHCHGTLKAPETTRMDVGVPCIDYTPISLEAVADIMSKRTYGTVDQHDKDRR